MFVTDADGTVMGARPEFGQYRAFRSKINELRTNYGIIWVVCTGRSLRGYKQIFKPMRMFGIAPDYVIINHAFIFECKKRGFLPHWVWNLRILWLQWKEKLTTRQMLRAIKQSVLSQNPFARVLVSNRQRLSFRFDDESSAAFSSEIVRRLAKPYKNMAIFQSVDEICISIIPSTKGLAVTELARHLKVANSQILVVGDGHNDISMMGLEPPCLTACPANAAPEVVETVHRLHGHIASERTLNGVLEVLDAYEKGQLNDKLPADWEESEAPSSRQPRSRGISSVLGTTILLALVVYTTLLVVASFIRIPGRNVILKPYTYVVETLFKGWTILTEKGK